jgi:hypothetical protein
VSIESMNTHTAETEGDKKMGGAKKKLLEEIDFV